MTLCDDSASEDSYSSSPRELRIGETAIRIPSRDALAAEGITESEYLAMLDEPAAKRIERIGSEGPIEVLVDSSVDIDTNIDVLEREGDRIEGTGCSTTAATGMSVWMLALLGLTRRR